MAWSCASKGRQSPRVRAQSPPKVSFILLLSACLFRVSFVSPSCCFCAVDICTGVPSNMQAAFYTLSSAPSSLTDGGGVDDDDDSLTLPTPPTPATHDTSRSSCHISDISSFAESLQDAANQAFPNRGRSRYHTVGVCLIRWEEDVMYVKDELDRLYDVFDGLYGFHAEIWLIPSTGSQLKLTSAVCDFLQKFDKEGNLFVVYYGGHATINAARQNQWWCRPDPSSPVVDWSAVQTLFGAAVSDVLILLDCCAAASAAASTGAGTMEAIAACGWETRAPRPGEYSFTHTLIEVLEDWAHKPSFSAAMLHTEVLFILKQKRPARGRNGRRAEWCATPIHWVYTGNPKAYGIEISSLRSVVSSEKQVMSDQSRHLRPTAYLDAMDIDEDTVANPLAECQQNGDYRVPHVLISIALEGEPGAIDAVSCRRWLAGFPALAKYATVEGVYKGYSTLMTISVPVMIWDLLPEHPACSFIGYIVSPNQNVSSDCSAQAQLVRVPRGQRSNLPSHSSPVISQYHELHRLFRCRQADGNLRSADSSYGSDIGSDIASDSEISVDADQPVWPEHKSSIPLDEVSSEKGDVEAGYISATAEPDLSNGGDSSIPIYTPQYSSTKSTASIHETRMRPTKSLLTLMLNRGADSSQPVDIQYKGPNSSIKERYRSPDQVALSPHSTRRNMLVSELSVSLRQHLLWERRQGLQGRRGGKNVERKEDGEAPDLCIRHANLIPAARNFSNTGFRKIRSNSF